MIIEHFNLLLFIFVLIEIEASINGMLFALCWLTEITELSVVYC